MLYATLYNNGAATVQRYGQAARSNCKFNVDANSGHAFGIFMAAVGALRPCGAPAPVNQGVRCSVSCDHIPRRSWALFRARDVMRGVIESFKAEQAA